jgi:hypothetical protein
VAGFDHVFLHVGSETVLRPEDRGKGGTSPRSELIGDVPELQIDRRRVANDANSLAVQRGGSQKSCRSKGNGHFTIIEAGLATVGGP